MDSLLVLIIEEASWLGIVFLNLNWRDIMLRIAQVFERLGQPGRVASHYVLSASVKEVGVNVSRKHWANHPMSFERRTVYKDVALRIS